MCVRYSPAECAEYGCATKIGTLLYKLIVRATSKEPLGARLYIS